MRVGTRGMYNCVSLDSGPRSDSGDVWDGKNTEDHVLCSGKGAKWATVHSARGRRAQVKRYREKDVIQQQCIIQTSTSSSCPWPERRRRRQQQERPPPSSCRAQGRAQGSQACRSGGTCRSSDG